MQAKYTVMDIFVVAPMFFTGNAGAEVSIQYLMQ